MTCEACAHKKWYDIYCIDCCVRLCMSTEPDEQKRDAMLHCVGRHKKAPTRDEIILGIKKATRAARKANNETVD